MVPSHLGHALRSLENQPQRGHELSIFTSRGGSASSSSSFSCCILATTCPWWAFRSEQARKLIGPQWHILHCRALGIRRLICFESSSSPASAWAGSPMLLPKRSFASSSCRVELASSNTFAVASAIGSSVVMLRKRSRHASLPARADTTDVARKGGASQSPAALHTGT